ncbi:hypothetical protein D3C72_1535080 [compost metagenome]
MKYEFTRILAISTSLKIFSAIGYPAGAGLARWVNRVTRPVASLPPPVGFTCTRKSISSASKRVSSLPFSPAASAEIRYDLPAWDRPKKPSPIGVVLARPRTRAVLRARCRRRVMSSASLSSRLESARVAPIHSMPRAAPSWMAAQRSANCAC